jgi:putative MATE family efflux protein
MTRQEQQSKLDEFIQRPRRAVWVLAGPMMVSFTVHALYHFVDMVFIGQLGAMELAAATFVGALYFVAIAVGVGFTTGVTANVAQAIGRRDKQGADQFSSNALGIGVAIGSAFAIIGLLAGEYIMPVLGAAGKSSEFAWQYFEILSLGMPFMFASMSIRSVLTGEGDAKTPMNVMITSAIINACLDPVFIFTLGLGIRGAAIATVIAQTYSLLVFSYIAFVRKSSYVRFRLSLLKPRASIVAAIARIGLPAAAGQIIMAFGSGLMNRAIATFGQTAVAGYGAGSRVDMMVTLPIVGLASASVSVVGMFAGASRPDLVRSTALYTYRWVVTFALIMGTGAFLASKSVIGIFTEDPHALNVGKTYLSYMVFAYPLMAFSMTSGRLLQGLGYGMPPLIITATRVLLIGVPGAYAAVYLFGAPIHWVWISIIAGGVAANLLAFLWVRHHIWLRDPTIRVGKARESVPPVHENSTAILD